ncbi:hypothetical protein ACFFWC_18010 [Plantactinospora siamensis]|uniref:Excreted virulence factor EspC (Type VII ESX diderm) n=1 Tax=Plantactinospora siamensis TaxID=555372 RepID=A0ABV6NRQ8_9ACTN
MTDDPISVRTGAVRDAAVDLVGVSARLRSGPPGAPPPVPAPGWATATALAGLEAAVRDWLAGLAARVGGTADALRAAADGYDRADERAAARLAQRR